MSDYEMISVEQVLYNLHMQLQPRGECKRGFCSHRGLAAKLAPLVHDMIKAECAGTAEDTRVRMVEAAARAVERATAPPFYYCPTSGEIEQTYEGGFTICCEAPLRHEPISPAAVAAAQRVPS